MKENRINFLEEIESNHQKYMNIIENASTINEKIDSLMNELSFYESVIPSFFSKYDGGEGNGIRVIYENLRNEKMGSVMFETVDLNMAMAQYDSYMEGMEEFVTAIILKNDGTMVAESTDSLLENIMLAKQRDSQYIDSIFGGSNNERNPEPYTEAVKGIEALIDFIPKLNTFKEKCNIIKSVFESSSVEDEINLMLSSMFLESVSNFCHHNIKEIINSYNEILESVSAGKKPIKKVEKSYSLF